MTGGSSCSVIERPWRLAHLPVPRCLEYAHTFPCSLPPLPGKTAIIFDWDDTLLCSSWLQLHQLRLDQPSSFPDAVKAEIERTEFSVIRVLTAALHISPVFVVTNSEAGWVEMACRRFMPRAMPLLEEITIISARSSFEKFFPASPSEWKMRAFHEVLEEVTDSGDDGVLNIISVGDSQVERRAIYQTCRARRDIHIKSIKFIESPSVGQLRGQQGLLIANLEKICRHHGNLDLLLTFPECPQ